MLRGTQQALSSVLHACFFIWLIEGHLETASMLLLSSCHQQLLFWSSFQVLESDGLLEETEARYTDRLSLGLWALGQTWYWK